MTRVLSTSTMAILSPPKLRNTRKRWKESKWQGMGEEGCGMLASEHDSHCAHELTVGVAAYTRPTQDCMHQHFIMDERAP